MLGGNIRVAGTHVDDNPTAEISGSVTPRDVGWGLQFHGFGDGLDAVQDASHIDPVKSIEFIQ